MPTLKNKRVLMTGATSGIGYEVALELLRAEAEVIALVREPQNAALVFSKVPEIDRRKLHFLPADLSRPDELFSKCSCYLKKCGGAQVVIHSAVFYGDEGRKDFPLIGPNDWLAATNVNFLAQVEVTRSFLATKDDLLSATIIALSSPVALEPAPGRLPYAASKAAAFSFFSGLAVELAGKRTNISQIIPLGQIKTPGIEARRPRDFDFTGYREPIEFAKLIKCILERSDVGDAYQVVKL